MSDEPLGFEENRRRREENAGTVRCARCNKWIVATATRCPECGIHFNGEAQDFAPDDQQTGSRGTPAWVIMVAVLLLLAMLVGGLSLG